MTEVPLRDQFAMAALTGILASPNAKVLRGASVVAQAAYEAADAMMERRTIPTAGARP